MRKGKRPFSYQGRGSVVDPGPAPVQYFQTGVSPRIKHSNPEHDRLMNAQSAAFDPEKRKKLINQAIAILNVTITPPANGRIYGESIRVG